MIRSVFSALALGATLLAGTSAASAQADPDAWHRYGPEARFDATSVNRHHVEGVVDRFGGFNMSVRVRGDIVPVNLHQGTIIHPTGLTLHHGMFVRCDGYFNGNGLFIAERITLLEAPDRY